MTRKALDTKLAGIRSGGQPTDFIIADAGMAISAAAPACGLISVDLG